ncbi:protease inhibitor I9 family protein [Streptomyces halstedii]|uniref:protease inhibitor I9 family protein n=1 Tax=Streptomyces halstedii TaxID=1944 RepID=UPI0036A45902
MAVPGELRIVPPGRQAESEVLPPRDRHRPVSRRRVPPASVLRPRRDTPHSRERRIPDEALSPRRTPAGAAGHRRPRRRRRRRLRPGRLPATDIRRAGSGPQAHRGQLHHHPQVRRGRQGAHEQRGHQRPSPLHVFNGFSAKLSADQLADLRRDPSVKASRRTRRSPPPRRRTTPRGGWTGSTSGTVR